MTLMKAARWLLVAHAVAVGFALVGLLLAPVGLLSGPLGGLDQLAGLSALLLVEQPPDLGLDLERAGPGPQLVDQRPLLGRAVQVGPQLVQDRVRPELGDGAIESGLGLLERLAQSLVGAESVQWGPPNQYGARSSRSMRRPRWIRDFTVPSRQPISCAISRYDHASTSRSTRGMR